MRIVNTAPITVPPGYSSKVVEDAWDSVFADRRTGGGPLLHDCPLNVEMGGPEEMTDYFFEGSIAGGEAAYVLDMKLVRAPQAEVVKEGRSSWFCANEIACAEAMQKQTKALAKAFMPLDDIIYDYERIPETVKVVPETPKWQWRGTLSLGRKVEYHCDHTWKGGRTGREIQARDLNSTTGAISLVTDEGDDPPGVLDESNMKTEVRFSCLGTSSTSSGGGNRPGICWNGKRVFAESLQTDGSADTQLLGR